MLMQYWNNHYSIPTLGAFLMSLIFGSVFIWGNIDIYVVGMLRKEGSPGLTLQSSTVVMAVLMSAFLFSEPVGGTLNRRIGGRFTTIIGTFFILLGLITSVFISNIYEFTITFGLIFGIGIGLCYVYPLQTMLSWTPKKLHGRVSGFMAAGLGLGGFIWGEIASGYLNPNNEDPGDNGKDLSSEIRERTPYLFLVYAGIHIWLILFAMIFCLKAPSEEQVEKINPSIITRSPSSDTDMQPEDPSSEQLQPKKVSWEVWLQKEFWFMWLIFITISIAGTFTSSSVRYVRKVSNNALASAIAGVGLFLDGIAQVVIWGVLIDYPKWGIRKTMFTIQFIMLVLVAFYVILSELSIVTYIIFYIGIMMTYSGSIPLFINMGKQIYGAENSGFVFACLESCEAVGTILETVVVYFLADSMMYVYLGITILVVLGIVLSCSVQTVLFKDQQNKKQNEIEDVLLKGVTKGI